MFEEHYILIRIFQTHFDLIIRSGEAEYNNNRCIIKEDFLEKVFDFLNLFFQVGCEVKFYWKWSFAGWSKHFVRHVIFDFPFGDVEISKFHAAELIGDVRHQVVHLKCLDSMELAIELGRPVAESKHKIAAWLQAL